MSITELADAWDGLQYLLLFGSIRFLPLFVPRDAGGPPPPATAVAAIATGL